MKTRVGSFSTVARTLSRVGVLIGRSISFAVGGQSLAAMFRKLGGEAFNQRLREIAPDTPPVKLWGHTRGGTLAASTNEYPDQPDQGHRHWWNIAEDRPAQEFVDGLERVRGLSRHACECLFWDLGQSEAALLRGKHGRDPQAARADFRFATARILGHWRQLLSPDDPERLPILIMPHAPHPFEGKPAGEGVRSVRAVQYELIDELANCHDAGIVRGMDMADNMHPSVVGIQDYARSVAETFARVILPIIGGAASRHTAPPEREPAFP